MQRQRFRVLAIAAVLGVVAGGGIGLFSRFLGSPAGLGGGASRPVDLVAIGSPAGGEGRITIYRGTEAAPCARTQVPWNAYNEAIGIARPLPLRLTAGKEQQIVVALGAMPGMTGGCIVVLDAPERGCKPLAWRRVVLGDSKGAHELSIGGGDVDGDGKDEIVLGSPQAKGEVIVLDDLAHGLAPLATLQVPWTAYSEACGETRPAVGDLDGDGKAEVVVGLGSHEGPGGWLAVFEGLRFSRWTRFPRDDYNRTGGGTWPAIGDVDGNGRAELLIGTDSGSSASIAVLTDPLAEKAVGWLPIPAAVDQTSSEVHPLCAALDGTGRSQVLVGVPDTAEACEAALFDDATKSYAFLGWRRGEAPARRPQPWEPVASDPGAEAREEALGALRARRGDVEESRGEDGIMHVISGRLSDPSRQSPVDVADAFLRENAAVWGITDPSRELSLSRERSELVPDECKLTHALYQQMVDGVPLLRHGLGVHMDETGVVVMVGGEFDPLAAGQRIDPKPRVSEESAVGVVKQEARASLVADPKPELVAWRGAGPVHLCWVMQATSVEEGWGREYVIDAHTAQVLRVADTTAFNDWVRPARAYGHTTLEPNPSSYVTLNVSVYDPGPMRLWYGTPLNLPVYAWIDQTRPMKIRTYYANRLIHTEYWPNNSFQRLVEPAFLAYETWMHPPQGPDLDYLREMAAAHRNIGKVIDYWHDVHSRDSWNRQNGDVELTHSSAENWRGNAAWFGNGVILVGERETNGLDRQATNTPLDVLAHEFTHAVVSGNGYEWHIGEAGAINEHVADAFGVFTECYARSETQQRTGAGEVGLWTLMDEEVVYPPGARWWVRNFSASFYRDRDGTEHGAHYPNHRDTRNLGDENDYGNIHDNARILDHWLYLWVHGGDHEWKEQRRPRQSRSVRGIMQRLHYPTIRALSVAERAYDRFLRSFVWGNSDINFEDFRQHMRQAIPAGELRDVADDAFRAIQLWPNYRDPFNLAMDIPVGHVLTTDSLTVPWSAVRDSTKYWLSIGTAPGRTDLYDADQGTNLSVTVTGLPTDGRILHIRLWYKHRNGAWYYNDATVTAASLGGGGAGRAPAITSPAPGSTLTSSSAEVAWSAATGATQYWLTIGTTSGGRDIVNRNVGTALTASVTGLPTNGSSLHVRVWYRVGGRWRHTAATYTAAGGGSGGGGGGDAGVPAITGPAPGSTLASSTLELTWSAGTGVTQYWLSVGSNRGGNDFFNQSMRSDLSATVWNLPAWGQTIYVRLWYRRGTGRWASIDATYVAANENVPAFIQPEAGSTITSSSVLFMWTPGSASLYWLQVGTTRGGRDLFDQNVGAEHFANVSGLPTDGRLVYARLSYSSGNGWASVDATYPTAPYIAPAFQAPAPGSTLGTYYAAFRWTGGVNVTRYRLALGTTQGGNDLFDRDTGSETSAVASGLPSDGRPVYARLWFLAGETWRSVDATYAATNTGERPPAITGPPPGSMLPSSTATFTFSAGPSARNRRLHYSPRPPDPGDLNPVGLIQDGGIIEAGDSLSVTATGLLTDHGPLYVWLTYEAPPVEGSPSAPLRFFTPYVTYRTAHADIHAPRLTGPVAGATCATSTIEFHWSPSPGPEVTNGVQSWWVEDAVGYSFHIGSAPRAQNTFSGGLDQSTWTVHGFPLDGRRMYVRFGAGSNADQWRGDVVELSMAGGGSYGGRQTPRIESPTLGSTLGASTTSFTWSAVQDLDNREVRYHLRVGSIPGANDLFDGAMGTGLSGSVSGLPTDGRTLYVRVLWNVAGAGQPWSSLDFTFTAAGGSATPAMTSPAPGSTLSSSTSAFTWTPAAGATEVRLRVGTSPGGGDLYDHFEGTSPTATVTGLPRDGRPIHVRLSHLTAGTWQDRDYTYTAAAPAGSATGPVWAWGNGHEGQLGDGGIEVRRAPTSVPGLTDVSAIAARGRFSLGLKDDGTVWQWGNEAVRFWESGAVDYAALTIPSQVPGLTGVTAISAGRRHALARRSDGSVWAWGANDGGELGYRGLGSASPRQVADLSGVTAIAAGYRHSLALKGDGTVWAWGHNHSGSLGNGTDASASLGQVPELTGVTSIAAGADHSLALKGDGTVWAWGINNHGQMGTNTRDTIWPTRAPVQVLGLTGVTAISAGFGHCLALKGDGTVWAWGNNFYGQLGNGAVEDSRVPVQVQNLTDVVAISAGCYVSLAVKSDGTVWAWGNNFYGQLGTATGGASFVPVRVQGLQGVTAVAAGSWHLLARSGQ